LAKHQNQLPAEQPRLETEVDFLKVNKPIADEGRCSRR